MGEDPPWLGTGHWAYEYAYAYCMHTTMRPTSSVPVGISCCTGVVALLVQLYARVVWIASTSRVWGEARTCWLLAAAQRPSELPQQPPQPHLHLALPSKGVSGPRDLGAGGGCLVYTRGGNLPTRLFGTSGRAHHLWTGSSG